MTAHQLSCKGTERSTKGRLASQADFTSDTSTALSAEKGQEYSLLTSAKNKSADKERALALLPNPCRRLCSPQTAPWPRHLQPHPPLPTLQSPNKGPKSQCLLLSLSTFSFSSQFLQIVNSLLPIVMTEKWIRGQPVFPGICH